MLAGLAQLYKRDGSALNGYAAPSGATDAPAAVIVAVRTLGDEPQLVVFRRDASVPEGRTKTGQPLWRYVQADNAPIGDHTTPTRCRCGTHAPALFSRLADAGPNSGRCPACFVGCPTNRERRVFH